MFSVLPTYTKYVYTPSQGQDHLGAESVALAIQAELLSGITSITPRARYFSFYAWVLYDFIRSDATKSYQAFAPFLRRREAAFILANLAQEEPPHGLLGVTKGEETWLQYKDRDLVPLDFRYLKATYGGYGGNYRAPMEDLRIIKRQDGTEIDHLVGAKGVPLAQAFEQAIQGTRYFQAYRDADVVPPEVLEEYGRVCSLDSLSDSSAPDREPLRALLMPLDASPDSGAFRRQSLAVFLDAIRQAPGSRLDSGAFRRLTYYGVLPTGQPYTTPPGLEVTLLAWRMFQHRQYYVFGLGAIWAYFLTRIGQRPATIQQVLSELGDLDLGEINLDGLTGTLATTPVSSLRAWINAQLGDAPSDPVSEERLVKVIEARPAAANKVGAGLLLLLATYGRICHQSESGISPWAFARAGAPDRLPFQRFRQDLDRAVTAEATVLDWLGYLLEEYLVRQHSRVAMQKLAWTGLDTYRFTEDGGFYTRLNGDEPQFATFRGISALQMLADVGLCTSKGLTVDGRLWLDQALSAPSRDGETMLTRICAGL